MKPETIAIHTPGIGRDGAVAASIQLSTTWQHGPAYENLHGFTYVRDTNPNVADLEARLAAMEGGAVAAAFASGMAAGAALLAGLPEGCRVIFHHDLYHDFRNLAAATFPVRKIEAVFIDMTDLEALGDALTDNTALVWFETPSNPKLDIIDIAAVSRLAHEAGTQVAVDGTFATPVLQRPLDLGADYVIHSLTKYMGGHSDIQGGAVIAREDNDAARALFATRKVTGGVLSPFNAWLVSRGLQTLHCRMEAHCRNAGVLAEFLSAHDRVETVHYPFLSGRAGEDIARAQMKAGGGMLSVEIVGGRDGALAVASRVKLILNATSLGGVESLIEHRASVEGPTPRSPQGLLRLSVGLENADDLIEDLDQALDF
ncbi:cystathionine gamma-synthase [Parvularcula flava]|nr:cystathionine gamma-synthase [Aquisalinus luteolus]